jgi:hypothetical protein
MTKLRVSLLKKCVESKSVILRNSIHNNRNGDPKIWLA